MTGDQHRLLSQLQRAERAYQPEHTSIASLLYFEIYIAMAPPRPNKPLPASVPPRRSSRGQRPTVVRSAFKKSGTPPNQKEKFVHFEDGGRPGHTHPIGQKCTDFTAHAARTRTLPTERYPNVQNQRIGRSPQKHVPQGQRKTGPTSSVHTVSKAKTVDSVAAATGWNKKAMRETSQQKIQPSKRPTGLVPAQQIPPSTRLPEQDGQQWHNVPFFSSATLALPVNPRTRVYKADEFGNQLLIDAFGHLLPAPSDGTWTHNRGWYPVSPPSTFPPVVDYQTQAKRTDQPAVHSRPPPTNVPFFSSAPLPMKPKTHVYKVDHYGRQLPIDRYGNLLPPKTSRVPRGQAKKTAGNDERSKQGGSLRNEAWDKLYPMTPPLPPTSPQRERSDDGYIWSSDESGTDDQFPESWIMLRRCRVGA